ncbi:MAG: exodeoxyribonuclease V gamma subunit, partial [Chlamydiales bacterium]
EPIKASDILVVLPDVGEYESVVRAIFGHENSQLDYRIIDFPFLAKSSIAQGFLSLLSLAEGRWDVASIFQVFEHPAFQYRHGLSADDVQLMRYWVKDTGIRWGLDHAHREEVLSKDYCQNEMVEKSSVATWDHGIGQLLMGLSMVIDDEEYLCGDFLRDIPCQNIDFSQSELLGKMIQLLDSLRDDLTVLSDETALTLEEWSSYLTCILDAYFSVALGKASEQAHYDILLRNLKSLSGVSDAIKGEKYTFLSVFRRLDMSLKKEKSRWQEGHIESVCFGGLKSLRAIPARVICLMGMEDGKFPRVQSPHVLNLMTGRSEADYIPRSSDEDRYLFLESILSSGEYFIMSQVGMAQGDSREISPSLVVTELLNYLDATFEMADKKPSDLSVIKHPQLPFNSAYFCESNSTLRSHSSKYFQVAKSLYKVKEKREKGFVPELFSEKVSALTAIGDLQSELTIDVKDLAGAVSNPLKLFFNKNLGIYLGKEGGGVLKSEEDFTLGGLDHALLKREALRRPVKEVLKLAEKRGRLPMGAFKEVACRRLERDVESWKENMDKMGADPRSIFSVEMRKNCDSAFSLPNGDWIVPSLEIEYSDSTKVHIVGRLPSLTPQGLLAFGKDSPEDILKAWPQYVVYDALVSTFEKPLERQLLFLKDGKVKTAFFDDAYPVLRLLIDYYFTCMRNVSPMIPEWFEVIWKKDPYKLQKKVKDSLGDGFQGSYNDYLKWMMSSGEQVPSEGVLDLWREYSLHIFGELVKQWMPKVEGKGGKKNA